MMKVSFNEEANIEISDELTLQQRKGIWCWDDEFDDDDDDIPMELDDDDDDIESKASFKARRHRVRTFVRFVVGEYKSLQAMGINDSISLYRISIACSKVDAVKARERASNGTTTAVNTKSSTTTTSCSSLLRKRLCSSRKKSCENNNLQISSGGNKNEHER
ncbi:hypothetical protein MHU86_2217 [Fragilaria crotonensis]|nr:hypothetical protein MHU86_2217 [Fragilaria crotonensis]